MPKPENCPIDKIYVPVKRKKALEPELVQEIADRLCNRSANDQMAASGPLAVLGRRRSDVRFQGDSVAKLQKWLAAIFPRKEQSSDNRRSMCSQARYRSCRLSQSLVAMVPHTIMRSPSPQPGKLVFSDPKTVLQHYRE